MEGAWGTPSWLYDARHMSFVCLLTVSSATQALGEASASVMLMAQGMSEWETGQKPDMPGDMGLGQD